MTANNAHDGELERKLAAHFAAGEWQRAAHAGPVGRAARPVGRAETTATVGQDPRLEDGNGAVQRDVDAGDDGSNSGGDRGRGRGVAGGRWLRSGWCGRGALRRRPTGTCRTRWCPGCAWCGRCSRCPGCGRGRWSDHCGRQGGAGRHREAGCERGCRREAGRRRENGRRREAR